MKECPAIIAALPREIKPLVRGWKEQILPNKITVYTNGFAVVACAGMGPGRATLAVQAVLRMMPVTALFSVGLAGACDPKLHVGDIVRAGVVVDAQSGERYDNSQSKQILVSAAAIASIKEKQRLYESYGASAVDMEAATVARMAQARGLDFQAIKAISDGAHFELQELNRFATHDGQFREIAFAAYSAVRPRLWSKLVHLAANSKRAIQSLTTELESQLDWYKQRA
ncbi:MAG: phosphorylase [Edaphobacter sp.]